MTDGELAGVRVVVTRARAQADGLIFALGGRGAEVIVLPVLEIRDPESWEPLDRAIARLLDGAFDWVAFTSANAVDRFVSRVRSTDADVKVAAVGGVTAGRLRTAGIPVDLVSQESSAQGLVGALLETSGTPARILLPRVEGAPRAPVGELESAGWLVTEVAAYRNVPATPDPVEAEPVVRGAFDAITFASGTAALNLAAVVGAPAELGLAPHQSPDRGVVCIGDAAAAAAAKAGYRVDAVATEPSDEGLAAAVAMWWTARGEVGA